MTIILTFFLSALGFARPGVRSATAIRGRQLLLQQPQQEGASFSWERLQQKSDAMVQEQGGRIMFTIQQLEKKDPELAQSLRSKADFGVARTPTEALRIYFDQPSHQLVLSFLAALVVLRCSMVHLQVEDLVVAMSTWSLWQVQEWFVHDRLFHGHGENQEWAHPVFTHHDHHHIVPFFHVATEPLSLCLVWFGAVSILALTFLDPFLGHSLTTTAVLTYTLCGLGYISLHYLTHTQVPLTGWLQQVRERHMSHHLASSSNLNMGPNVVDQLMGTSQPLHETILDPQD